MIKILINFIKFYRSPVKFARELGVKVGNRSKIATSDFGSEPFLISIGDDCHITKKVKFITHDGGVWVFRKEIADFDVFGAIEIKDNVYIGNNTVIMPGVVIESNVVVGANSVITKSIPANSVVAGVPARIVCSLADYKQRLTAKNFKTKGLKGDERRQAILQQISEKGIKKDFLK